jgi:hypothetical protein
MQWDSSYSQSVVRDLAKYGSDHCPLVLHTSMTSLEVSSIFKCDIVWFDNPEFNALVIKWWSECILRGDIGKAWDEKIKFMRRKIKGWHKHFLGEQKRKKQSVLAVMHYLDRIREIRDFTNEEANKWLEAKSQSDDIYLTEKKYWHTRAKEQWFKVGDHNSAFSHRVASNRKKNIISF